MSQGKLDKMRIEAYAKATEKETPDKKIDQYTVMVNPEKYTQSFKSQFEAQQGNNNSKAELKFVCTLPTDLDLELLFDRTGVIVDYGDPELKGELIEEKAKNIAEGGIMYDIERFKKVTFDYNGNVHKPNYLRVTWGTLTFDCYLAEMTVEYKLFGPNGKPLRALVKVKFKAHTDDKKRILEEKKTSPDLTHVRTVTAGDTLPLMTYEIYGDSSYYLEVAKANQLTQFRKLTPGQQIFFPPIQKSSINE